MTINEIWEFLRGLDLGWTGAGILVLLSLIQISPVKLDPWDMIFNWLGNKLNGSLQKQVREIWINMHRQAILQFARECRAGQEHSEEEWSHVLNVADEYEQYCLKNSVVNGIVKQDTLYIRQLYQELSRDHRIG
jgi:hypothetical protein